jgi:hypothetical protein
MPGNMNSASESLNLVVSTLFLSLRDAYKLVFVSEVLKNFDFFCFLN